MIKVTYSSIDRFRVSRSYKTLDRARKFAQEWIGAHPDIGCGYAVSNDGIGKIQVVGATLAELFPAPK